MTPPWATEAWPKGPAPTRRGGLHRRADAFIGRDAFHAGEPVISRRRTAAAPAPAKKVVPCYKCYCSADFRWASAAAVNLSVYVHGGDGGEDVGHCCDNF